MARENRYWDETSIFEIPPANNNTTFTIAKLLSSPRLTILRCHLIEGFRKIKISLICILVARTVRIHLAMISNKFISPSTSTFTEMYFMNLNKKLSCLLHVADTNLRNPSTLETDTVRSTYVATRLLFRDDLYRMIDNWQEDQSFSSFSFSSTSSSSSSSSSSSLETSSLETSLETSLASSSRSQYPSTSSSWHASLLDHHCHTRSGKALNAEETYLDSPSP